MESVDTPTPTPTPTPTTVPTTTIPATTTIPTTSSSVPVPMTIDTPSISIPPPTTTTEPTTSTTQEPIIDLNKLNPNDIKDTNQLMKVMEVLLKQHQQYDERVKQIEQDAEIGRQATAKRIEQEALDKKNKIMDFEKMLTDVIEQRNNLNTVLKTDAGKDEILGHLKSLQTEFTSNPDNFMKFESDLRTAHAATAQQMTILETKEKELQDIRQQLEKVNSEKQQVQKQNEQIAGAINDASILKKIEYFLKPPTSFGQYQSNSDNQTKVPSTPNPTPTTSSTTTTTTTSQMNPKSLIPTFDMKQFPTFSQMIQNQTQTQPNTTTTLALATPPTPAVGDNSLQQASFAASASSSSSTSSSTDTTTDYKKTMAEVYAKNSFFEVLSARYQKDNDYTQRSAFAASQNAQTLHNNNDRQSNVRLASHKQLDMFIPVHDTLVGHSEAIPMLYEQVPGANEWDPEEFNKAVSMGRSMGLGMAEPTELIRQVLSYNENKQQQLFGYNKPQQLGNVHNSPGTNIYKLSYERDFVNSQFGIHIKI